MKIAQVKIQGFRNFKSATVNLTEQTLVIGTNDVGKTNFLYALRILLDRTLSEADTDPLDSDFFAYEETNEFSITLKFDEITDNVRARFRDSIGEDNVLYLKYVANREPDTGKKTAIIYAGEDDDAEKLQPLQSRHYLKTLNLRYIGSNRDLISYIGREKKYLLQEAKNDREEEEKTSDNAIQADVQTDLESINSKISRLSYMKKATAGINKELRSLSVHHEDHEIIFEVGSYEPSAFIDSAHLATKVNDKHLAIGGDGRNNQIFLSLWASRNRLDEDTPTETVLFAIEEPEAHLHPHQQRKLAEYLANNLNSQVIITSHSPQIACRFAPSSIVRFCNSDFSTTAASEGCTPILETTFINFGHRLDVISAEIFFANVVFLVEGQSEVLFYKALAKALEIDLDRLNISILMVNGVGFETYLKILDALEINWVLRTDNDIFKIPKKIPEQFKLAGVERGFDILCSYLNIETDNPETYEDWNGEIEELIGLLPSLRGLPTRILPAEIEEIAQKFKSYLKKWDIFISEVDLESDLLGSEIKEELVEFIQIYSDKAEINDPLEEMQKNKATFMYHFLLSLGKDNECLAKLKDNEIAVPLFACKSFQTESL